jgi:hypothetical protein
MTVLPFWKHKLRHHEELSYCDTCGGAEGELPEHCPQRKMTTDEKFAVYADDLDFRKGKWTTWTHMKEMRAKGKVT